MRNTTCTAFKQQFKKKKKAMCWPPCSGQPLLDFECMQIFILLLFVHETMLKVCLIMTAHFLQWENNSVGFWGITYEHLCGLLKGNMFGFYIDILSFDEWVMGILRSGIIKWIWAEDGVSLFIFCAHFFHYGVDLFKKHRKKGVSLVELISKYGSMFSLIRTKFQGGTNVGKAQ